MTSMLKKILSLILISLTFMQGSDPVGLPRSVSSDFVALTAPKLSIPEPPMMKHPRVVELSARPPSPEHLLFDENSVEFSSSDFYATAYSFESAPSPDGRRYASPMIQLLGDREGSPGLFLTGIDDMAEMFQKVSGSIERSEPWIECDEYLALIISSGFSDESDLKTMQCVDLMQEEVMMKTQVVLTHFWAYLVSRHLLQRVQSNILGEKSSINLLDWPDVLETDPAFKKTLIPLSVVQVLKGLIATEDGSGALYEFRAAEEALYQVNFFIPGGSAFMDALVSIDDAVSRTMRHYVFIMPLRKEPIQHQAALHMSKMRFSPSLQLAAEMPDFDVIVNHQSFEGPKAVLTWTELRSVWESLRLEFPHTDLDGEGIFGIDCLVLRLLAKSLSFNDFDGVEILKKFSSPQDPIPKGTLSRFAHCLARSDRVDLVALPMMLYHLISPHSIRENHFKMIDLLPLFKIWSNNVDKVRLDRAAKLRAALYFKEPHWWVSLREGEGLVVQSMFPDKPLSENEEFNAIVTAPYSYLNFERFKRTFPDWPEQSQPSHIQVMSAVLEFISFGIRENGNWIAFTDKWLYVVSQFANEFNSVVIPSSEADALLDRIEAVTRIGRVQLRAESVSNSHAVEDLFLQDRFLVLERLNDAFLHPSAVALAILIKMSDILADRQ